MTKKYNKITKENYEKLNTLNPLKNKNFSPVLPPTILLPPTSTNYIHLLNIQLQKTSLIFISFLLFLSILIFFVLLNPKLKFKLFHNKKQRQKI
ncbi:DUF443 family protein, partial [Staphylococcus aureus]|uniref:DUF443 family protein n=1 Tax=Staphylococcus aureus TaxID=1280 RepID=UPI0021B34D9C